MKRILLAEDEEVLRMLVVDTLEDEGYQIDEASDGLEAMELLKKNHYDLVLLDYMMPQMTGLEVIENVRKKQELEHLQILMLTAKSQKTDQEKIINAGANYFLAKPFSPIELISIVGEILGE